MIGAKIGFHSFLRDEGGTILPMAAIGLILSAALVGGGIDMSRAYRVQNRLQSACDASVLAGRRAVTTNGYDTTAKGKATNYFNTNFDDSKMETATTVFTSSSSDNGGTITGSASTELNLAVMKMFGFQKFNLAVSCQATMGVGNSDVVMVLDTTGSMGYALGSGTRIAALRTAMKNFYTTVKTATTGTNSRIRYGFVPFSSSVNVGRLLSDENPAYLADSWQIQSRQMVETGTDTDTSSSDTGTWTKYSTTKYGSDSCGNNVPNNTAWTNVGSPSAPSYSNSNGVRTQTVTQQQSRTRFRCQYVSDGYYIQSAPQTRDQYSYTYSEMRYRRVNYDVSAYKGFTSVSTNTGSYGAAVSSTWNGCIEERSTTAASSFSYSTINGITPAGARDLDIDSAPTSDPVTQWGPMWPEVAYYRSTTAESSSGSQASSYCPYQAQLLTSMTQAEFNSYADLLYPEGSTYLDIGMGWGGRLSSPTGIFANNVNIAPSNGGEVSRHLIFMSDGDMQTSSSIQTSWGIEFLDRRITTNGDNSSSDSRHTSRFLALCAAIKAKGIRVWTISFTTGTSSDLQTCASPNSYFDAADSTELNDAFQEIAKQVGELRISQ